MRSIDFHVVKGLSEQVLLSNQHSQMLGLVTIKNEKLASSPEIEHPGSFRSLINNLSLVWPEPEILPKTKHTCLVQQDPNLDDLKSIASEIESNTDTINIFPNR